MSSCAWNLLRDERRDVWKPKENGETYWDTKTSGMCCQENDKSSPSSHLSLPLAARIFSSTHYYPLSRSARSFSPPSRSKFWLFLPFQLLLPNISFLLSCPHFCCSSSSPSCHFLSLSCLLPPLILCLPSPTAHLLTPPLPPSPTLCTHNLPLSYSVFWLPPLLLSLRLFFHFFSPVCCDRRQAGDSCNSRQSSSGHRQGEGGKEGMQRWRDSHKAVGLEGVVTFLLERFWSFPKQKQRRRRQACGAVGWLLSIPRARISSVLMHCGLAATSVKLLYLSPWHAAGTRTEVVVLCLNKQQLWACSRVS